MMKGVYVLIAIACIAYFAETAPNRLSDTTKSTTALLKDNLTTPFPEAQSTSPITKLNRRRGRVSCKRFCTKVRATCPSFGKKNSVQCLKCRIKRKCNRRIIYIN